MLNSMCKLNAIVNGMTPAYAGCLPIANCIASIANATVVRMITGI